MFLKQNSCLRSDASLKNIKFPRGNYQTDRSEKPHNQSFFHSTIVPHEYGLFTKGKVKDGWILDEFLFCAFTDRDGVKVHKLAKKRGKYPANLTEQAWSIKYLFMAFLEIFLSGHGR